MFDAYNESDRFVADPKTRINTIREMLTKTHNSLKSNDEMQRSIYMMKKSHTMKYEAAKKLGEELSQVKVEHETLKETVTKKEALLKRG